MNKKINLLLVGLLVFYVSLTTISASATYPKSNPTIGKDLYATVDESFDFSKVKFGDATGSNGLKKIFLGDFNSTSAYTLKDAFTAYCLDASKTYPDRGYQSVSKNKSSWGNEAKVQTLLIATLFNSEFNYKSSELAGFKQVANISYTGVDEDALITSLDACRTSTNCTLPTNITIKEIGRFIDTSNNSPLTINQNIDVTLEKSLYEKYKVEQANTTNVKGYEEAMWIISNTYPMTSIENMLSKIEGVTLDGIKNDIKTLEGTVSDDLIDKYIYSIVQYAVWHVTESKDTDGKTISTELSAVDSSKSVTNLAKLYSYLITEGKKHDIYNPGTIKINVNKPEKPIEKETNTDITSGKYSFSTDSSLVKSMVVTIENNEDGKVKLLDSNMKEMTLVNGSYELTSGEEFTISVPRKSNITKVTINAYAKGEIYDKSSARKYSPYLVLNQSFITGRMTTEIDASATLSVDIGPATGVENVAILLVVTLVSFSIGYLVLGYKNKPVEI